MTRLVFMDCLVALPGTPTRALGVWGEARETASGTQVLHFLPERLRADLIEGLLPARMQATSYPAAEEESKSASERENVEERESIR